MYILLGLVCWLLGFFIAYKRKKKELKKKDENYMRVKNNEDVLNQWLIYKQRGVNLDDILQEKNIKTVAVYGMAIMGRNVVRELKDTEIFVQYGMDNKKMEPYEGVVIAPLNDNMEKVDLVINTVLHQPEKDKVEKKVLEILGCRVISLDDLIFNYTLPER